MSETNFKTLYYFMHEEVSIIEIELTDLADDAPKENRFHWYKYLTAKKEITKLTFKSMSEEDVNGNLINVRVFEEAELRFDKSFGKFSDADNSFIIMKMPTEQLPEDLIGALKDKQ